MNSDDYYEVLGLGHIRWLATEDDIKKAYHRTSLKCAPRPPAAARGRAPPAPTAADGRRGEQVPPRQGGLAVRVRRGHLARRRPHPRQLPLVQEKRGETEGARRGRQREGEPGQLESDGGGGRRR